MKNKNLSELFVRGRLHTIVDEEAEAQATVFLKKLNLTESELAVRKAAAARSVVLSAAKDPESEAYKDALADAKDTSRDALIDFIIGEELARARESAAAELGAQPEWSDDQFLQGLNDAWTGGLKDVYIEDPEDVEAKRVFEHLQRYTDEVDNAVEGTAASLRLDYAQTTDEELWDKAVKQFLKNRGDLVWVDVYRKWEIAIAVRDPDDHKKRLFGDASDLDDLETEALLSLMRAYRELSVEPAEGKDLPETPSS